MAKKNGISLDGAVDPQQRFYKVIDEYFAHGDMERDLDQLTPEKRLGVMGKFAEFRWGKKTANPEDDTKNVTTTGDLLAAVYDEMQGAK